MSKLALGIVIGVGMIGIIILVIVLVVGDTGSVEIDTLRDRS